MATPGKAQQCRFVAVVILSDHVAQCRLDARMPDLGNSGLWGMSRHTGVSTEVRLGKSDGLASHERPH